MSFLDPIGDAVVQSKNEPAPPPPVKKLHPVLERSKKIILSLGVGSFFGYVVYWVAVGASKLGLVAQDSGKIRPLPYVLSGLISAALVETIHLTYDLALHILGKQEKYENLPEEEQLTKLDRFRNKSWKCISKVQKVNHKIDQAISSVFRMRTLKKIRQDDIKAHPMNFREIFRKALLDQIKETVSSTVPAYLGDVIVKACGYNFFANLQLPLYGLTFILGTIDKVTKSYHEKMKNEDAAKAVPAMG